MGPHSPTAGIRGNLRLSQRVPLRLSLFPKPVACPVEHSSFALCTSCIFKQQFLRTDASSLVPGGLSVPKADCLLLSS